MTQSLPMVPLAALGTLVFTFVNFLKFLRAGDRNSVFTQLIAWVAGVVSLLLFCHTQFATHVAVGDLSFASLNVASQIFLGLLATSLLSTFNELRKAIDSSDSSVTPTLLPSNQAETPPAPAPVATTTGAKRSAKRA